MANMGLLVRSLAFFGMCLKHDRSNETECRINGNYLPNAL